MPIFRLESKRDICKSENQRRYPIGSSSGLTMDSRLDRFPRLRRALPYIELACAVGAAGLWYQQGGAVWYTGAWPGAWPLLLLGVLWLSHLVATGAPRRPSVLDLLLWIFLASALLGVWAAYDPGPAWAKFWLIVGAIGLYYAVTHQPDQQHLYAALGLIGGLGLGLSLYFFMNADWAAFPIKIPALVELGRQISEHLPILAGHHLQPNVAGGLLAAIMPVYVPLVILSRQGSVSQPSLRRRWLPIIWICVACLSALTLLITRSRGAWIAVMGMAVVWALWRGVGRWLRQRNRSLDKAWKIRLVIMAVGGTLGVVALTIAVALILTNHLPGSDALANRLGLLHDSLLLARDYPFTGAGLGMFEMQFSIYTLLIHVGYIVHSHNLLLNILIEQGLVGLVGFVGLITAGLVAGLRTLRQTDRQIGWIVEAGLASSGIILIHGLVDDTLYGSRGALLLFMSLGLIIAASRLPVTVIDESTSVSKGKPRTDRRELALAVLALIAVGMIWWRPVLATWSANQGAVEQARVELSHYDQQHFDNPTMDQVRQRNNLDEAIRWFNQALTIDPTNGTARRRLAAIQLARGQYVDALANMQVVWDAGQRDAVTRMLLGDAEVANGRVVAAVDIIQGLPWAETRLEGQAYARYWVNADFRRAADAWAAVVKLDPANTAAAAQQAEAERRAQSP